MLCVSSGGPQRRDRLERRAPRDGAEHRVKVALPVFLVGSSAPGSSRAGAFIIAEIVEVRHVSVKSLLALLAHRGVPRAILLVVVRLELIEVVKERVRERARHAAE